MRHTAYHGSPGPAFDRFDAARSGSTSGYDHARGSVAFTSSVDVALGYAEQVGFVGRFAFSLDNPLEIDDADRPMGIGPFIEQARDAGHDGLILRRCAHTAISPGEASDIFIVFDAARARLVKTVQEGPEPEPGPPTRRRRRL